MADSERTKGNCIMDGFINLIKPAGMTSHDAVFMLRRILRTKKIGHTGTLDPMAMGVLPICIGKATRAAEYLEADRKRYRCEMLLGYHSDTGDIWGNISKYSRQPKSSILTDAESACFAKAENAGLTDAESTCFAKAENAGLTDAEGARSADTECYFVDDSTFRDAILSMQGRQLQYPPAYSAVRKNGRRLYEYARDGIEIEVEPKEVLIYEITPVRIFHEPNRAIFDVECSKGTYVRTICEEIGRRLGTEAIMTSLIRTASGSFSIEDAITFEDIIDDVAKQTGMDYDGIINPGRKPKPLELDVSGFILETGGKLSSLGKIVLNDTEFKKFINGGKVAPRKITSQERNRKDPDSKFADVYRVYSETGVFAGTALFDRKRKVFTPGKVFFK